MALANVQVNRKMLADVAVSHPEDFKKYVEIAQEAIKGNFDSEAISTFTYGRGDIGFTESQIDNKTFKDKGHQKTLKNIL